MANAELQLGYTEIRAPIAGRTGQRLLHEGALVKANDNNFPLVTINQLAPVAVTYAVPERALDEIREAFAKGQVSVVVTDRNTGTRRENGRLEFIDNTVDPATGNVTVLSAEVGFNKIWGLGYWEGVLYGFTDDGLIITIDRTTGVGTQLYNRPEQFWGAGVTTNAKLAN